MSVTCRAQRGPTWWSFSYPNPHGKEIIDNVAENGIVHIEYCDSSTENTTARQQVILFFGGISRVINPIKRIRLTALAQVVTISDQKFTTETWNPITSVPSA